MSLVKKYRAVVLSVINPANNIYHVEFGLTSGKFKYNPGQFLHLALDMAYDGSGQWPESRCFSMQSNPDESSVRITYSVKGNFTGMMKDKLKKGSEVWLKMPYGDLFSQPHNKSNAVFIAGGTGITPFLSLFTHSTFNEYLNPRIYLGFRSKRFNVYDRELSSISHHNPKIFYEDSVGLINTEDIYLNDSAFSDYFLSGPTSMIRYFTDFLISAGVDNCHIKTDNWE